ncbi:dihydrodipicolinate synthase family protein [Kribbella sp. ALI-6-A]|uniref:dihydrodipicolinate synthase family protein n=1 Tax=Kribbella sp. ALI-6-A TaxID=1933817 RepID=UPI00143DAF0C|nr:dihydrodipicolinate synthase family protein [Kribbella sp. ALI-6-A]
MTSTLEIWAATPTPFGPDGELFLPVVADQGKHLLAHGVHGAFVGGTSGEFPALTTGERKALVDAWAAARPDGLALGTHVGHSTLAEARELAAHAQSAGVDLIASVTPYFGVANTLETAVDFLAAVAAEAPTTPFLYYHFPGMTGSPYRPSELVALAVERIPNFAGVKFTHEDLLEFDRTRAVSSKVRVYFGRDELLPAALAFGADAVIGSLYNALAPQAHQVAAAMAAGRLADALMLHEPFRQVAAEAGRYGGVGFVKEWLNACGPDTGVARTPWGPLPPAAHDTIERLAASWRAVTPEG